jgi:hypothetical protein
MNKEDHSQSGTQGKAALLKVVQEMTKTAGPDVLSKPLILNQTETVNDPGLKAFKDETLKRQAEFLSQICKFMKDPDSDNLLSVSKMVDESGRVWYPLYPLY